MRKYVIIILSIVLFSCCSEKSSNEKSELNKIELLINAITYNNWKYRVDCEDQFDMPNYCLKLMDSYSKNEIRYFDFMFVDCENKMEEVSFCNDYITGLGINKNGEISQLIKHHKVILDSYFKEGEVDRLVKSFKEANSILSKE